jgi:hypothetical protein
MPCSSVTFGHLVDYHQKITGFSTLKRGTSFQAWAYGDMTAIGSRVAQGGRAGDAYAPYAGMDAQTEHDIKALFGHAHVSAMSVLLYLSY